MARDDDKGRYQQFHGRRAMLNLPGHQTTAAIVAEVEDSSTWSKELDSEDWIQPRVTLQIANCDRSISFEVEVEGNDADNDLKKVETLISVLTDFRAGLVTERRRAKARDKRRSAT